jgi:ribosome biogenesis protein YTM1
MGDAQVKVVFTTTEQDLVLPEEKKQLLVPAGTLAKLGNL